MVPNDVSEVFWEGWTVERPVPKRRVFLSFFTSYRVDFERDYAGFTTEGSVSFYKIYFFLNTYILNLCESIKNFLVPIINPLMLFFVKKLVLLNFPIPIPLVFLVVRSDA